MAFFDCQSGGTVAKVSLHSALSSGVSISNITLADTKENWESMTIVATGLAYSSGNRIDIRSASGVLYSTTTPGTYTFTKNQFASPITSVALMSYNASGSSISIELK